MIEKLRYAFELVPGFFHTKLYVRQEGYARMLLGEGLDVGKVWQRVNGLPRVFVRIWGRLTEDKVRTAKVLVLYKFERITEAQERQYQRAQEERRRRHEWLKEVTD